MNHLMNMMAMRSSMAQSAFTGTRQGVITAYDPVEYAIKVTLQPTGEETGWIPLGTPWAGAGWGFAAGPMIGAEVEINFDSGTVGVGMAGSQFYNNEDRCPGPPSGELWIVHQSGSLLKFLNSGAIVIQDKAGSAFSLNGDGTSSHNASAGMTITADIQNDGKFQASGFIKDLNGAHGDVNNIRTVYNGHTHHENGEGSDTDEPNQQIT